MATACSMESPSLSTKPGYLHILYWELSIEYYIHIHYLSNKCHCIPFFTVAPNDYKAVMAVLLTFNIGDSRQCHNVTIESDTLFEQPPESFFSDLVLVSSDVPISVNPSRTEVLIVDSE